MNKKLSMHVVSMGHGEHGTGMHGDGTMWAQDEHECGMNVMQPCIAMHGMRRVWCSERK